MEKEKIDYGRKSTKLEKVCYAMGDVGCNFIWTFASAFLTLYYTDSAGLGAAFVAAMMLTARVLDGISDIGMGIVIEKTRTKWGKARPWILFGAVPFALSLVLLMNVPSGLTIAGKSIYAYITYIFMAVFCYTAVNLAYHAMLPRFSLDKQDRNIVSVVRTTFIIVIGILINILTPSILAMFGGERNQKAWSIVSGVYAVLALICLLITFFGVKEQVPVDVVTEQKEKTTLKESGKAVLANKYFYIDLGLCVVFYMFAGLSAIGIYYARDVLGNAGSYSLLVLAQTIPMLLGQFVLTVVLNKFSKRSVCIAFTAFIAAGGILIYCNPVSLPFVLIGFALRGFGGSCLTAVIFTFSADLVDYGEWKTGIRAEGFAYAATSFGMKVGTGIGSAIVGLALSLGQYDPALSVQKEVTIKMMIDLQAFSFIILSVILILLLILWDYDKVYKKTV